VKAFNTAFAARQADPMVSGGLRVDGYVAGDDEDAKATVFGLVEAIGFNPVDAGSLAMARHLEGMAWLNISLQMKNSWSWQAGWKLVGPEGDAA
jgi:8-hydroxy-5-deazaflavin:NADPH oxidoreductase